MARKINCIDQETKDFLEMIERTIQHWACLKRIGSDIDQLNLKETAVKIKMFIYRKTEQGFYS